MSRYLHALLPLALAVAHTTSMSAGMPGVGTWETTLLPRDINSDGAIDAWYDTTLNITWLDQQYVGSSALNWYSATDFAATYSLHGIAGWRLPRTFDQLVPGGPGPDFGYYNTDAGYNVNPNTSELAFLFHITLGNNSEWDASGTYRDEFGLNNTGPFRYLRTGSWSETIVAPGPNHPYDSTYAWGFDIEDGFQNVYGRAGALMYWQLVREGDVTTAVPEMPASALLLSGLFVVCRSAMRGRRRKDA